MPSENEKIIKAEAKQAGEKKQKELIERLSDQVKTIVHYYKDIEKDGGNYINKSALQNALYDLQNICEEIEKLFPCEFFRESVENIIAMQGAKYAPNIMEKAMEKFKWKAKH